MFILYWTQCIKALDPNFPHFSKDLFIFLVFRHFFLLWFYGFIEKMTCILDLGTRGPDIENSKNTRNYLYNIIWPNKYPIWDSVYTLITYTYYIHPTYFEGSQTLLLKFLKLESLTAILLEKQLPCLDSQYKDTNFHFNQHQW